MVFLSCSSNDESKEGAIIDSTFRHIDSTKKVSKNKLVKFKPLRINLGYTMSLVDEEIYTKAVDKGIKFVADTSDFKKVGNR
ncbi:MAG: hypothetical protein SGJ10_09250 [Bacteroidota bacterium]|nr:hypothetical protein [Bacteroidota bacterium]